MIIVKRRAGQHHAVGVEGCGRDGSRAVMLQEARIWFDAVEEGAINIKDVDLVLLGAPVRECRRQ